MVFAPPLEGGPAWSGPAGVREAELRRSLTTEYLSESKADRVLRMRRDARSHPGGSQRRDFGQDRKGIRWMPWRQEAMKDVASCEMLREAAKQAVIRRCPNGETRPGSCPVIRR